MVQKHLKHTTDDAIVSSTDDQFSLVCRGFSGTYVKEYIEVSNPAFAIGEYWDSLAYEHGNLCYNQGNQVVLKHCCVILFDILDNSKICFLQSNTSLYNLCYWPFSKLKLL